LGQVCLLGLALLSLVATGGDGGGGGGGGEPGLPPEASEAAMVLLNLVSIESTADVLFSGPVEPGTVVRENDIPEDQVELQVPDTPGTYYIFLIDDHPNKMFEHHVRYAWVNLDTSEVEYIDASNLMTIYPPNREPSPFRKVGSDEVNGIFFNFYEGEGAAEPVDVTHKTAVETFNASDIGVSIVYHSRRESLKIASVTDFGDENGIRSLSKNMAERNADRIGKWVKDNGFNVQRISQYSGNNYPRFNYKPSTNVTDYIASFGTFFKSIGPPDEYCDEFFLYITGHGKGESPRENGGVKLYPANGAADFEMVYWEHLLAAFDNFPPYVKVTVFLDACFSGKAIIDLPQSERVTIKQGQNRTKLESLCNKLCVITVITSTDQHLAAIAPQFLHFSATEDFMIGDSRYADFDEDGIKGDIYDRTITMKGHVGNTNPQFYHCPPGESWCSLDGSQTVWDEPPIANAGDDQVAELDSTVQLDGSNSSDPEGALLFYEWTFKSKPEGSNAVLSADNEVNPTFVSDVLGDYTLELIVNDGFKDSEPSTVTITVTGYPSPYTNSIGQTFVLITAGTFTMGSPVTELRRWKEDQHQVTLTQPYYMMTTEVTQAQWKKVMGSYPPGTICDNCPVETATWDDAQTFIQTLNTLEGTDKYRLPTEAEWEYAARAGSTTAYANGDSSITEVFITGTYWRRIWCDTDTTLDLIGWYCGGSFMCSDLGGFKCYNSNSVHEVALKIPNSWGLYDMHGNANEWCQDWYGDYPTEPVTDPTGPPSGSTRVLRGGAWHTHPLVCRSAARRSYVPSTGQFGFRLARTP